MGKGLVGGTCGTSPSNTLRPWQMSTLDLSLHMPSEISAPSNACTDANTSNSSPGRPGPPDKSPQPSRQGECVAHPPPCAITNANPRAGHPASQGTATWDGEYCALCRGHVVHPPAPQSKTWDILFVHHPLEDPSRPLCLSSALICPLTALAPTTQRLKRRPALLVVHRALCPCCAKSRLFWTHFP